ncbi:MAG: HEAT repeat domain-containing protein, partial [Planctomycetota bacterium]
MSRLSGIWHLASGIVLSLAAGLPLAAGEDKARAADPLAVEQALTDLRSGDWVLQWQALRQLADWEVADAAPAIREVLAKDRRPWVRGRALVALARLFGDELFDEVARFARRGEPELRAAAVEALGVIGAERAVAVITERLDDKAPAVRHQALVALARVQGKDAWDTIEPFLGDEDPDMVRHAARALGYVRTPQAVTRLLALLGHDEDRVRRDAAVTLGRVRPPEGILPLLRRMASDSSSEVRDAGFQALVAYEPTALTEPLLEVLRGEETDLYASALRVLARRPTRAATDRLATLLRQRDPRYSDVVPLAFDVLAAIDPDAYLDVFTSFLDHDSSAIRKKAVAAVARCSSANPFVLLRDCLTARDRNLRYLAYKAMRAARDKEPPGGIVAFLAEPLRSDDPRTVKSALALLGERITHEEVPAAVEALAPLLASGKRDVRRDAIKALEQAAGDDARRRIAQTQGYVTDWMVLGSFPNDRSNKGFEKAYAPEKEERIDFDRLYESHVFGYGARFEVRDVACGGESKSALSIRLPEDRPRIKTGSVIVPIGVELPERDGLRFAAHLGLADDAKPKGDGVRFQLRIGDQTLLKRDVKKVRPWLPVELDLDAFAGQAVTLELTVNGLRRSRGDHAAVGEPRILAGEEVVADLLGLARKAKPRVAIPGHT